MRAVRAANNINRNKLVVIRTADDPRSNWTVGAGGDSSSFVVTTPVEEIDEELVWSVIVGVEVTTRLLLTVVLILAEVLFTTSETWKLALMTRS